MKTFADERPLMGQDPFIFKHEGDWLLIESKNEEQIVISTLSGLQNPRRIKQQVVWDFPCEFQIWAPELHYIEDAWFIYYTSSDGNNVSHRPYILGAASSPFGPYTFKKRLGPDIWGIDMTTFQWNNKRYVVWSGWASNYEEFPQNLYIAEMYSPISVGPRVLLAEPDLCWEKSVQSILEGPQAVIGDQLQLLYAANASWTREYATGTLTLVSGDPLVRDNWVKDEVPLALNCGHGMQFEGGYTYHTKLSPFDGWTDRRVVIDEKYGRQGLFSL